MEARSRTFRLSSRMIHVSGEVDAMSAARLRERIRKNLDLKPHAVVLKLSDVTAMDSAGVAVLVEGLQWAKKEKVIFVLAEPSPAVRSMLEMARLSKLFYISETLEKALPE